MSGRTLIAGIGNIFLADDGFGVEVAHRLAAEPLPRGVEVADVGIRGLHLAYRLLDGYDVLILVDAVSRGEEPGTVFLIEPDLDALGAHAASAASDASVPDAHGMDPESVLRTVVRLGGRLGRVVIVGCEPARLTERIGLSAPVRGALDRAVSLVQSLLKTGLPLAAPRDDAARPETEIAL